MMSKTSDKNRDASKKQGENKVELEDFAVEFRKYKTELTEKFKNRKKWEPKDESKIISVIPGKITKIYVSEGDVVVAGKEIMVLEAMKMKNVVISEVSGLVKKINVKVGDLVSKGKVIFEFELSVD